MITEKEKKNLQQFYRAVLALEDEEECRKFFDDVATIKEALDLSARLEVARLLDEGVVFSEISKATGASSATISRVNKCLTYGEGGYKTVLDRIAVGNGKEEEGGQTVPHILAQY
jgi:TrpR-related protein YerC/YecD